jgi:hypothetical protein
VITSGMADRVRPLRVAFTAAVGSHLETARFIEDALREGDRDLSVAVVDLVGFSRWDATAITYSGRAQRRRFELSECGLDDPRIDSSTWPAVLEGARRLLSSIEPDLLVTMDDSWYDQHALILCAREMGVPAVLVQEGPFVDGIGSDTRRSWRALLNRSALTDARVVRRLRGLPVPIRLPSYGGGNASEVMVASRWYASRFIAAGVKPKHVTVTGIPRYDPIPRIHRQWVARRSVAATARPPKMVLLSQPFVRYKELTEAENLRLATIARSALEEVARRVEVDIEIRLHPSDQEQDVDALVSDRLGARLVRPGGSLVEALAAFDVVVGFSSGGLLEAMAVGVPTVIIETPSIAPKTRLFRRLGAPVATDVASAVELITTAVSSGVSPALPSIALDEMGVLDGRSSSRVAAHCRRLVLSAAKPR